MTQTSGNTGHGVHTPMSGWTAADFLDSAKRLREYEQLSLADDLADQLQVAAKLLAVHGDLVNALRAINAECAASHPSHDPSMPYHSVRAIQKLARAALAKAGQP